MKIVADDKIPFLKGVLEPFAKVEYYQGEKITAANVKDADALIIRTRTRCDAKLLEGSSVKFIATATIGFDHIDTNYCKRNGLNWTNAPGCNSGSVMQYIASALVFLSQKYNFELSKKTIGVVGVGNVGSKVAHLASLLGMNVLLNDPPRERKEEKKKFVSLNEIQKKADIISFHVPLNKRGTDKTHHLFNADFLEKINSETIIINSSRGEVISTTTIKNSLKEKKIKTAILDVWENEPNIDNELLEHIDIGTPHIAGYSAEGKAMGTVMSVQALSRFFGLGLNDWFPDSLPSLPKQNIEIDCQGLSFQEITNEAILSTYNIKNDYHILRDSIKTFEQQRGNYPLRREFSAFKISLKNDNKNYLNSLKKLGFR